MLRPLRDSHPMTRYLALSPLLDRPHRARTALQPQHLGPVLRPDSYGPAATSLLMVV
ncbi:hypothetical protein WOLCODRAFT_135103 [Wolfiporia cocos MD-104 SS10]|uniref:Uncharacterized protein n=1 Tax=Wolfiporia cocos (strain MD-104) TaxID=742152 RepID=A0A2H3IUJ1_WOLCO|nr:hypothetical protein WOLCODRAFT_135103 [Wolfiporia cocos MD-104 SS10]